MIAILGTYGRGHEKPFTLGNRMKKFNQIHFTAFDNAVGAAQEQIEQVILVVYGVFSQFLLLNHRKMFSCSQNVVFKAMNSIR